MAMTLYQVCIMFSINIIQLCKCFREAESTTASEAQRGEGTYPRPLIAPEVYSFPSLQPRSFPMHSIQQPDSWASKAFSLVQVNCQQYPRKLRQTCIEMMVKLLKCPQSQQRELDTQSNYIIFACFTDHWALLPKTPLKLRILICSCIYASAWRSLSTDSGISSSHNKELSKQGLPSRKRGVCTS